jgi:hypothetical protein
LRVDRNEQIFDSKSILGAAGQLPGKLLTTVRRSFVDARMLIPRLVASSIAGILARTGKLLVVLIKLKLRISPVNRAALQIPELSRMLLDISLAFHGSCRISTWFRV